MKSIVVLGATGSLGKQTLEIIEKYPDDFELIGISANQNQDLLSKQAKKFSVPIENTTLTSSDGQDKLTQLASHPDADIIVNVLSGVSGINPSIAALKSEKTLLLGNKESLIAEGTQLKEKIQNIIPLDSEHNAIHEIIKKFPNEKIKSITLPCSGGPFLGKTKDELKNITIDQVLAYPKWNMGPKISVESTTLINKGLEIIEAHYLFNIPLKKIKVVIHPEAKVHGLVQFENETLTYISNPDMREHIENALLEAANKPSPNREIRPLKPNEFNFKDPDHETFPGIKIVLDAFQKNQIAHFLQKEEQVINKFLDNKITFLEIFTLL